MMQPDLNIWGWLAMPVGVLFCFGPVLVVWALAGFGSEVPAAAEMNLPEQKAGEPRVASENKLLS